jgi:hypothetical protein
LWFDTQGDSFEIWNEAGLLDRVVRGSSAIPRSFLVAEQRQKKKKACFGKSKDICAFNQKILL